MAINRNLEVGIGLQQRHDLCDHWLTFGLDLGFVSLEIDVQGDETHLVDRLIQRVCQDQLLTRLRFDERQRIVVRMVAFGLYASRGTSNLAKFVTPTL
ncbi:hypothetical protein GCM10007901_04910 [Dyella acidisoli]|uniref:Uncharacterized protein n=1 Tax=Dyella acidisoli TaxID=1867834 RepID=A0ABQ5XIK1_9GAMM|nr:hypothetical protein GCM10007901_04910 [Dyella acidisoli]